MTVTASNLINELKIIGYDLYLEGENLKYRYTAITEPPKDKVIPLLDTLKRNKGEVKEYLTFKDKPIPFNILFAMLMDAVRGIEGGYSPAIWESGLMETKEYRQAWDRLNDTCLSVMQGGVGIQDYKNTLAEWQGAVKGVI